MNQPTNKRDGLQYLPVEVIINNDKYCNKSVGV